MTTRPYPVSHQALSAVGNGTVVDYSYVFGKREAAVRHDPHAHRQPAWRVDNWREISEIILKRSVDVRPLEVGENA